VIWFRIEPVRCKEVIEGVTVLAGSPVRDASDREFCSKRHHELFVLEG